MTGFKDFTQTNGSVSKNKSVHFMKNNRMS